MAEKLNHVSPPRILIAGCGDLGCQLAKLLARDGMQVSGLRRSTSPPFPDGVVPIQGDVTEPQSLVKLRDTAPEILVYCVAATAQSDESYRAHYVEGLRNVLSALKPATNLLHVFFVSSTRVYGQKDDGFVTEESPAMPTDFGGRRLLEAESLLANLPCHGSVLRLSGIYGPGRTHVLNLASRPQDWPKQNSWTNRIHRDDAAAFIAFLVKRTLDRNPVHDCYIVTDCCPVPQYEILNWIAGHIGVDTRGIVAPSPTGGKKLSNARLLSTGFQLRYRDYRAGYSELVGQRDLSNQSELPKT